MIMKMEREKKKKKRSGLKKRGEIKMECERRIKGKSLYELRNWKYFGCV